MHIEVQMSSGNLFYKFILTNNDRLPLPLPVLIGGTMVHATFVRPVRIFFRRV